MTVKLGQLLMDAGLINLSQLNQALKTQKTYGGKLGTNLVELGFISEIDLVKVLAKQLQMQSAQASEFEQISAHILQLIPKELAEKHQVIPLSRDGAIKVAFADPADITVLNSFAARHGLRIQPVIAPEIWIVSALERYYGIARDPRYITVDTAMESEFEITHDLSTDVMDSDVVEEEPAASTSTPSPSIQTSSVPLPEVMSVAQYIDRLEAAQTSKDVCTHLFAYLAPIFTQMALYTVKGDLISGAMLSGFPMYTKTFSELQVSMKSSELLKYCVIHKQSYAGLLAQEGSEALLVGGLGIPKDRSIGLYPLVVQGKVFALLLGVPQGNLGPPRPKAGHVVTTALRKAGLALDLLLLRRDLRRLGT